MGSMQVKQKRDQYRPKVRTSRNYCLQPASHAILEPGSLKRPEPERGIETSLRQGNSRGIEKVLSGLSPNAELKLHTYTPPQYITGCLQRPETEPRIETHTRAPAL